MNTFGNIFRLTTFGESHGPAVGGVVDGMPAGIVIDMDFLQAELNRRKPGQSSLTTPRKESDTVELLSGVFEGKSTGCPIFRPSHADYTYFCKYGIRDHRGGGRSSARETISRVVGGALAKMALQQLNVDIIAYTSQVGGIALEKNYQQYDFSEIEKNAVRCPDPQKAEEMKEIPLVG